MIRDKENGMNKPAGMLKVENVNVDPDPNVKLDFRDL